MEKSKKKTWLKKRKKTMNRINRVNKRSWIEVRKWRLNVYRLLYICIFNYNLNRNKYFAKIKIWFWHDIFCIYGIYKKTCFEFRKNTKVRIFRLTQGLSCYYSSFCNHFEILQTNAMQRQVKHYILIVLPWKIGSSLRLNHHRDI